MMVTVYGAMGVVMTTAQRNIYKTERLLLKSHCQGCQGGND